MIDDLADKTINDAVKRQISSLPTDELVKDILTTWAVLRETYPDQIQQFKFPSKTKKNFQQLAQVLYEKYQASETASPKVEWDEVLFQDYYSIWIYGKEHRPVFAFPYSLLMTESINSEIFFELLQNWSPSYVELEEFTYIFWRLKRASKAEFSFTDLKLLKVIFSGFAPQSVVGIPTIPELRQSDWKRSDTSFRLRARRLYKLGILYRRITPNYARLGFVPLIKIFQDKEEPNEVEKTFTLWETVVSPEKHVHILVIPRKSFFWFDHPLKDSLLLQTRQTGTNIELFNGTDWQLERLSQIEKQVKATPRHWTVDYTLSVCPFDNIDVQLLYELVTNTPDQTKELVARIPRARSTISTRLKNLQAQHFFQCYFLLHNCGLSERFYLFARGPKNKLVELERFVHHLPRYFMFEGGKSLFSLIWLPPVHVKPFLEDCSLLEQTSELEEYYYGRLGREARYHSPNLPDLRDEENNRWFSEV